MRVTVDFEQDEHQFNVTLETDQAVEPRKLMQMAVVTASALTRAAEKNSGAAETLKQEEGILHSSEQVYGSATAGNATAVFLPKNGEVGFDASHAHLKCYMSFCQKEVGPMSHYCPDHEPRKITDNPQA